MSTTNRTHQIPSSPRGRSSTSPPGTQVVPPPCSRWTSRQRAAHGGYCHQPSRSPHARPGRDPRGAGRIGPATGVRHRNGHEPAGRAEPDQRRGAVTGRCRWAATRATSPSILAMAGGRGAGPGRRAVPQAARDDRPGQPGSAAAVGSTQPVGDKPDVLALDRSTGWLYVAGEGGKVTVLAERGRSLTALGSDHLADGAHIVAVDPLTHRSYFPIPNGTGGRPELLIRRPCRGRDSAGGPRKAGGP